MIPAARCLKRTVARLTSWAATIWARLASRRAALFSSRRRRR